LNDKLAFYVVTTHGFVQTNEFTNQEGIVGNMLMMPFTEMHVTKRNTFLAASTKIFVRVPLSNSMFPHPIRLTSDYILYSALTIGHFGILNDFFQHGEVRPGSFYKKIHSEGFRFPAKPPPDTPAVLAKICRKPPLNWATLDSAGRNFLFCYLLTRRIPDLWKFMPLFSIWALRSMEQTALCKSLKFKTAKQFLDSLIPLWAKTNFIITQAIIDLITKNRPAQNEVDVFLLLAVLVDQKKTAQIIAKVAEADRLAAFFQNFSTDERMRRRIERSGFEAQKQHRKSLAAMFFVLCHMKHQAVIVLQEYTVLQVLVARLIDHRKCYEFNHLRVGSSDDDFYGNWWSDKRDDALKILQRYHFARSEVLAVEWHKYELLKAFKVAKTVDLLNLQLTPNFLLSQLRNQISVSESEMAATSSYEVFTESRVKSMSVFSFGASGLDMDSDDYSEEEDEPSAEPVKFETDLHKQFELPLLRPATHSSSYTKNASSFRASRASSTRTTTSASSGTLQRLRSTCSSTAS
jgi:hypothetical protein